MFLGAIAAAYVLVLSAAVEAPSASDEITSNSQDALYFGLHGICLVAGILLAVFLALWLRRSKVAYATLLAAWLLVFMIGAQVVTFELACEGHNDIIRHWRCEANAQEALSQPAG